MDIKFDPSKGDFGLELSVGPGTENPADMFQSLAGVIRAFDDIDREFARTIDPSLDLRLVLQSVEIGSLRTWLASKLRVVPDEVLIEGDWNKILGFFLVKAKHKAIQWLDGKKTIESAEQMEDLRRQITDLKNEVERLRRIPAQDHIPMPIIVTAIRRISTAMTVLPSGQTISYASSDGILEINRSFGITDEQIEAILTKNFRTERTRMMLTVKKPDYLGKSMWDLVVNGHTVKAKIIDEVWLRTFQHRGVPLLPGDALSADVRVDAHFDEEGRIFETKHIVEEVHEVVKVDGEQLEMFGAEADSAQGDGTAPEGH